MLRSKLRLIRTGVLLTAFLLNLGASSSFSARARTGQRTSQAARSRPSPATASVARTPVPRQGGAQASPAMRSHQRPEAPRLRPPTRPQRSLDRAAGQRPIIPNRGVNSPERSLFVGPVAPGAGSGPTWTQPYGGRRQLAYPAQVLQRADRPQGSLGRINTRRPYAGSSNGRVEDWMRGDYASGRERDRGAPERSDRVRPSRGERRPQIAFGGLEGGEDRRAASPRQGRGHDRPARKPRPYDRAGSPAPETRASQDVVGNPIPGNATWLQPASVGGISTGFRSVTSALGTPSSTYVFVPRSRSDYWEGYWDGFGDGYRVARHHRRHRTMIANFFYGYYFSDPAWAGFYHPGYYASIYHYWGWCPGWVQPGRVYYDPVDYIHLAGSRAARGRGAGPGIDYVGAERAILAVRRAWRASDIGSVARHLSDQVDIHIHFDGEYTYTISAEDFYAMTADMMATTQTVEMQFADPVWLSTHEVIYTGSQSFYDPDGDLQAVYVSYRLRQLSSGWDIVAIGSSLEPIEHGYMDFRYL